MEGEESLTFEVFGDYGYVFGWARCKGVKLEEGHKDVLVGFGGVGVVGQVDGIDWVGEVVVCAGESLGESMGVRVDGRCSHR